MPLALPNYLKLLLRLIGPLRKFDFPRFFILKPSFILFIFRVLFVLGVLPKALHFLPRALDFLPRILPKLLLKVLHFLPKVLHFLQRVLPRLLLFLPKLRFLLFLPRPLL